MPDANGEAMRNFSAHMAKLGMRAGPDMDVTITPAGDNDLEDGPDVTVCKTCRVQLNEFTSPDGVQWVHTRFWVAYDHDPEPIQIPRSAPRETLCDFCGRPNCAIWSYRGNEVRQNTGNIRNNYGSKWAACRECAALIDDKDLHGLADRAMQGAIARSSPYKDEVRAHTMSLQGAFIRTIHDRSYIGPPIVPAKLHPRNMPKIRDGVIKFWQSPKVYQAFRNVTTRMSLPGFACGDENYVRYTYEVGDTIAEDHSKAFTDHLVTGLRVADLYYISRDFTYLATTSARQLPDISVTREELPSSFGFVIWEEPIGTLRRGAGEAAVRAASWTLVPKGVWVNVYIQVEDGDPDAQENIELVRSEIGWLLCPNTGLGLPFGTHDIKPVDSDTPESTIFGTILATWFLMSQPGVSEEHTEPADKGLQRAYKRQGRRVPDVRVIDLRRHATSRTAPESIDSRKVSVRFMVRGHWKRQAYGPGRSLRKTIYIAPFVKGPDGAPLKVDGVPTVKVLR